MSISLCSISGGAPERLAALLELCRDAVDEIVVALDDRVDLSALGRVPELADRVVLVPYEPPFERTLPWLYAQCRGDWILRLDDDEVPSAALLASLRELTDGEVTHVWLPRRWLYPSAGTYLDAYPWLPDFQLRLSVNDPRLVRFAGLTHVPLEVAGGARYVEQPLYHLDLLRPREERAAKAEAYERARPGVRVAGRSLNHALYLPEDGGASTAAVPDADAALVRRVLDAAPQRRRAVEPPRATREEIDAWWPLAPVDDAVRMELVHAPAGLEALEQAHAVLRVRNDGRTPLVPPGVQVGTWWDETTPGPWTPLPAPVPSGGEALVLAALSASAPGRHVVDAQLVHGTRGRFGPVVRISVEVVPRRRVGIYVREATRSRLGETVDAVTAASPALEPVRVGETIERSIADGLEPGRRRMRSFGEAWRRVRALQRDGRLDVAALVLPSLEATTLLERWADVAAVELADGAPVLVAPPPPPRGALDRLLLRRILRSPRVTVGGADELPRFLARVAP